ncbi:putative igr protein domain-containing protein [Eutypa lata UCREL1]|uniref:Small ribosomal subunit protein mS41 n=1 Tax=Eutypa lata (strain UCR-EL1) TaxID=1287681 RepID=M7SZ35_EUTLA|nr:putative igr protein domain-containing protein [Eutypa lata UCREL1]
MTAASFSTTSSTPSASAKSSQQPDDIIPSPTPFIPDVQTFLTVIGRGLGQHASKFPSWEALFTLTSEQLQELGIEPPRTRRYLLQWRQRFRRGQFGIGGDLQHVGEDGAAELRVLETDGIGAGVGAVDPVRKSRFVVNVPPGVSPGADGQMSRVSGYKVKGAKTIVGPYALPLKNEAGARVAVTEGMWEDRRGHKIDGGERRRTEVRYKKRIAERKELREQGLL